jgi:hypothetical protein
MRGARVVAHRDHAAAIRSAMAEFSLHEWARHQPSAQPMRGRAIAYGTTLADSTAIVVRHSQHGGILAPITGDLFLHPTRAPLELEIALRLAAAGVRTPRVVAYAVYPAFPPFARADVATERLYGLPFPEAWERAESDAERDEMIDAVVDLLRSLKRAGAQHPDLNARNILMLDGGPRVAAVLDVDRIVFPAAGAGAAAAANAARLLRSLTGERLDLGRELDEAQLSAIRATGATA